MMFPNLLLLLFFIFLFYLLILTAVQEQSRNWERTGKLKNEH